MHSDGGYSDDSGGGIGSDLDGGDDSCLDTLRKMSMEEKDGSVFSTITRDPAESTRTGSGGGAAELDFMMFLKTNSPPTQLTHAGGFDGLNTMDGHGAHDIHAGGGLGSMFAANAKRKGMDCALPMTHAKGMRRIQSSPGSIYTQDSLASMTAQTADWVSPKEHTEKNKHLGFNPKSGIALHGLNLPPILIMKQDGGAGNFVAVNQYLTTTSMRARPTQLQSAAPGPRSIPKNNSLNNLSSIDTQVSEKSLASFHSGGGGGHHEDKSLRRIRSMPASMSSLDTNTSNSFTGLVSLGSNEFDAPGSPECEYLEMGEEERYHKLARKAEAARASRRRRKAYVQSLEGKVGFLVARVSSLEAELIQRRCNYEMSTFQQYASNQHKEEQQNILHHLQMVRKDPSANWNEAASLLNQFTENSQKRQLEITQLCPSLGKALEPGIESKLMIWLLTQKEEFYDIKKTGLWKTVMKDEMGLDQQQLFWLTEMRGKGVAVLQSLKTSVDEIKQTYQTLVEQLCRSHRVLAELRRVLSPQQQLAFVSWVAQNPLCMQMLQTVWHET